MALSQTSIKSAIEAAKRKRAQGDLDYQRKIAVMYRRAFQDVFNEASKFTYWAADQKAQGNYSPSWLMRQERYLSLQTQLANATERFGKDVSGLLAAMDADAARWGTEGMLEEARRAAGVTGPLTEIGGFGTATWARLDTRAMETALALAEQRRSPLFQLLEQIGPDVRNAFRNSLLSGLASGKNPLRIARNWQKQVDGLAKGRAQTIARTEWHRAVRQARSEAYTESNVIRNWTWRAAMDGRTCGVCYLMHGTVHPTTQPLEGHPNCRCVMIPVTKDWHELGLPGIPNTKPPIEPGASQFRRLPEKDQRRLIGPTRLEMFKNGSMKLRDMTWSKPNTTWGPMRQLKPLGGMVRPKVPNVTSPGMKWLDVDFSKIKAGRYVYDSIHKMTEKISWTRPEASIVSAYMGSFYRDFNRWARGLPGFYTPVRDPGTISTYEAALRTMNQLFSKASTTEDVIVYRGMSTQTQPIRVGGSFVDGAPMSTTTSTQIRDGFVGGDPNQSAVLKLLIPKGSKAVNADTVAGFGGMGESEILVAPGSRVRILREIEPVTTGYGKTVRQYEGVIETP